MQINKKRLLIKVEGVVQGIGFRPFVYKLAKQLNCTGFVKNTYFGVHIEIEGKDNNIKTFKKELTKTAPPLSLINKVSYKKIITENSTDFLIKHSLHENFHNTLIPPDIATCKNCEKELLSKHNRRYNYPFINCTNCGPRYTIIEKLPYDRPFTSMKNFPMCKPCQEEYNNPQNRRFHAQPNACFTCGPHIWLETNENNNPNNSIKNIKGNNKENVKLIINNIVSALINGSIIALKGIGGFHLVVDANNKNAISKLRKRKHREKKPLAIIVANIKQIKNFALVNKKEEQILKDPKRPIVLLNKKKINTFPEITSSNSSSIGVMLAYTPLHHLIINAFVKTSRSTYPALVMTSANISDEPIAIKNNEAKEKLKNIADIFILHNRDILIRCDDSVLQCNKYKISFIRRSRGYIPLPIKLKITNKNQILALGAELKNTFCLLKNSNAFISQHIGDLSNYEAYNFFNNSINHLKQLLDIQKIQLIAHDMHPHYLSSKWAENINNIPKLKIQHHHAHLASCMADNKLTNEPVIGLIMDGTGYGLDGTIWGGEILIGNYNSFERYYCFEPYPLLTGEKAIQNVWITGFSYLYTAYNGYIPNLPFIKTKKIEKGNKNITLLEKLLIEKINCPLNSSCGRLFDAISAIIGITDTAHYEGEAAIKLMEKTQGKLEITKPFDFEINNKYILLAPLISSIVNAYLKDKSIELIAKRFHYTLIEIFKTILIKARQEKGINKVVISGGVFQNNVLLKYLTKTLKKEHFNVYTHSKVPCNDGGLSLGQASIAAFKLNKNNDIIL